MNFNMQIHNGNGGSGCCPDNNIMHALGVLETTATFMWSFGSHLQSFCHIHVVLQNNYEKVTAVLIIIVDIALTSAITVCQIDCGYTVTPQ